MVTNITSLTGNGLKDWLIQRVTALYLLVYLATVLGCLLGHATADYATWHALFQCRWVQLTTILAIISIMLHAWIGIWTITTDYIRCTALRLSVQMLVLLGLLLQLLWGIQMIWGQ